MCDLGWSLVVPNRLGFALDLHTRSLVVQMSEIAPGDFGCPNGTVDMS
jgi:hypothetical protein